MYVYIKSEPNLFTVGFYDPGGKWHPESDWNSRNEAADRVSFLNGSKASNYGFTPNPTDTRYMNQEDENFHDLPERQ